MTVDKDNLNLSNHPNLLNRARAVCPDSLVESYQSHGAVVLRGVLNKAELAQLEAGIESNLKNLSSRAKVASRPDDPGYFVEDFVNWQAIPEYQEVIFKSPLGPLAALLMKSAIARLYHDHLLVKEPNTRQKTPWHQDQPYYNIDGRQNVSFWIPVDPVPLESTLEFIAGSHLGPWLMPRTFMDNQAKWFPEGSLAELPAIEADRSAFEILGWGLEPGDVVAFHMLTLHAAPGVDRRRRVFSVRFLGDDIVHAPRRWVTSPHFENLENELAPGVPMEHPLFPLVYSLQS